MDEPRLSACPDFPVDNAYLNSSWSNAEVARILAIGRELQSAARANNISKQEILMMNFLADSGRSAGFRLFPLAALTAVLLTQSICTATIVNVAINGGIYAGRL